MIQEILAIHFIRLRNHAICALFATSKAELSSNYLQQTLSLVFLTYSRNSAQSYGKIAQL